MKAVACEPPAEGAPLSRRSAADLHRLVVERGLSDASASTILRWLREDAIRPWRYRSWIFPTDPDFAEKAGRVLDLHQGRFEGRLLHPGELVICADEKPRSRPGGESTSRPRPPRATGSSSSTPTSAAARFATSQPGTCAAAGCSAAQSNGAGSCHSTGSSIR